MNLSYRWQQRCCILAVHAHTLGTRGLAPWCGEWRRKDSARQGASVKVLIQRDFCASLRVVTAGYRDPRTETPVQAMILLCYPHLHVTSWMTRPLPSHTPVLVVRPRAALSWSLQVCLLNEHRQQARPTKTRLPGLGCCLGFCQAWFGSQSTLPSSPKENTGLALQQARVPRLFSAIIGKRPVKDPGKPPSCTLPNAPFPRSDFSKIPTNSQMLFSSLRNAFPHMVFSQSPEQHSYKVSPSLKILKREQFLIPPFWLSVQHTERGLGSARSS